MILTRVLLPVLLFSGSLLPAQAINWQHMVDMQVPQQLAPEPLTPAQRHDVEQVIVASNTVWDDCEDDNDWPGKLQVHRVNLGPGHYTLAEAGPGCARSGQGANGAMWLLRWDAGKPVLLGDLDGGFRAALPQISSGLRDVAVVWHNSADEFGLTLYRFNGKRYRLVDGTTVHCGDDGNHCVAAAGKAQGAGAVATPTKESAHP